MPTRQVTFNLSSQIERPKMTMVINVPIETPVNDEVAKMRAFFIMRKWNIDSVQT